MKENRPVLIFVHHFGGDSGSWQWLIKRLRKRYTCIPLNLPGFGNSKPLHSLSIGDYADWINDQIRLLEIKDYILIGHSMGGKMSLYAASIAKNRYPKKLILIAPSPPTKEPMSDHEKRRMLMHPSKKQSVENVKKAIIRKIRPSKFLYEVNSQLRTDQYTWKWWITDGMNEDISLLTKSSPVPVTVVCSKKDPVIPLKVIEKDVLSNLNNARLFTLGRSGHLLPLECPRKLGRLIHKIATA